MKRFRILLLVLAVFGTFSFWFMNGLVPAALPEGVKSEAVTIPDPGDAPLASLIWYPASIGTAADSGKHPLVIISHGTGGSRTGHVDTAVALAKAGFIVAAVEHTGDNYRDLSHVSGATHLVERPRHVARAIDFMVSKWNGRASIDSGRIGVFGHSAGGFTALVMAGAKPNLSYGSAYCKAKPQAWTCLYMMEHGIDPAEFGSVPWVSDPRVKAIAVAAPAIGYSFDLSALAAVKLPVQLWAAERDEIVDDSAQVIGSLLPAAERHREQGTGHFSFIAPCNWQMRAVISVMHWFGTDNICDDAGPLDRVAFHQKMNKAVVQFFERSM